MQSPKPSRFFSWKEVWQLPAAVILAVVCVDQWTKYLVVTSATLMRDGAIEIIPDFFSIVRVHNTGAAWGLFSDHAAILTCISAIVFIGMAVLFSRFTEGHAERGLAVSLILGGIAGNFIDRLGRVDGVVDFLCFYYRQWQWPSFNVADSCICIGVGFYCLSTVLRPRAEPEKEI